MIFFTIFLVFITWLLILWISNQHKYLNIFEQLALWFWVALSLFVFEIFIFWIVFDILTLALPIITFVVLLIVFIYFSNKKWLWKEVLLSVKNNFCDLIISFKKLKTWQKLGWIFIILYVIIKIFLSFSINTYMPTFDEDSVTGWDMKTKVFVENKSLVLDNNNVEFLWSVLSRNIFAPLTDTYFLLWYKSFPVWLSNIISPLIYFSLILLLFWIFLRKTSIFYALVSIYIFASLPFIFIHSIGSYFNYISWFFLFTFAFYLWDQVFSIKWKEMNKYIVIPLWILAFLDASIRNESMFLMFAIFILELCIFYFYMRKKFEIKKYIFVVISLVWLVFSFFVNKYIAIISPLAVADVSQNISWWIFSRFFENISKPWVFTAPFSQSFFHPDYNLLYLLYFIGLIMFFYNFKKLKEIQSIVFASLLLLGIFMIILFINVVELWLLTHYSFVRYPIAITPFLVFIVSYFIYYLFWRNENKL